MSPKRFSVVGLIVCLGIAGAAPAAEPPRSGQEPALNGMKVLRNLEYVQGGHERQKLDLYLPEKAEGVLPVIVWIHGGGWKAGNKDHCPAVSFVAKGYAVASINYRLSQHAKFPAKIEDCKAAIRWLRAHAKDYQFDVEHIGVWGASAGGHLVALLGTTGADKDLEGKEGNLEQSSKVQAVVDWFGPTDFQKLTSTGANSPVAELLGGPIQDNKEKAAQASPVTHVSKDNPPFLIMHGDKDPLVPFHQSEDLEEALKKAGVEVTLVRLKGAGHGGPQFSSPENRKLIADFFDKYLKNPAKN